MERRVLLAIFLCFLSLYLWQTFVVKPVPKPLTPPTASNPTAAKTPAANPAATPTPTATSIPGPAAVVAEAPAAGEPLVGETTERDIRVETSDVIAVFTNRGARLKSWRLKHYFDADKQPQELVVSLPNEPLPLTLRVADDRTTAAMTSALYAVSGAPSGQAVASTPTRLRFELSSAGNALHGVKEIEIAPSGYVVTVNATAAAAGNALPYGIIWGPAVGDIVENSRYVKKAEGVLM